MVIVQALVMARLRIGQPPAGGQVMKAVCEGAGVHFRHQSVNP